MIDKKRLAKFVVENNILTFGQFKTNSGRMSPYFCNFGHLSCTKQLRELSVFYADLIIEKFGSAVDNVFGPAYKGISLALMVSDALSERLGRDVTFTFNRKEVKDHGEKGTLLGYRYQGGEKVVIVEDVITSGKSLKQASETLKQWPVKVMGSVVCIDREENALDGILKATEDIEDSCGHKIASLITVSDLFKTLEQEELLADQVSKDTKFWDKIKVYQETYF